MSGYYDQAGGYPQPQQQTQYPQPSYQQGYQQPPYQPVGYPMGQYPGTPQGGNGVALAGLVLGIVTLVCCTLGLFVGVGPYVGVITGIAGIICSIIGIVGSKRFGGYRKGVAIGGLVASIIGFVLSVAISIFAITVAMELINSGRYDPSTGTILPAGSSTTQTSSGSDEDEDTGNTTGGASGTTSASGTSEEEEGDEGEGDAQQGGATSNKYDSSTYASSTVPGLDYAPTPEEVDEKCFATGYEAADLGTFEGAGVKVRVIGRAMAYGMSDTPCLVVLVENSRDEKVVVMGAIPGEWTVNGQAGVYENSSVTIDPHTTAIGTIYFGDEVTSAIMSAEGDLSVSNYDSYLNYGTIHVSIS